MKREFTGRHFAIIMVIGFGIVVAVNFTMAGLAARSFSGIVVKNSYVASQQFNGWLDEAASQRELGWQVSVSRNESGMLQAVMQGAPSVAQVTADLRRPLGEVEATTRVLSSVDDGLYISREAIPEGRWIVLVTVEADGKQMQVEERIE